MASRRNMATSWGRVYMFIAQSTFRDHRGIRSEVCLKPMVLSLTGGDGHTVVEHCYVFVSRIFLETLFCALVLLLGLSF